MLIERTSYGVTTEYYYSGTKLVKQRIGNNENEFYYDAAGRPYAMTYLGSVYYYIVDLFGNVLGIYDKCGTVVVRQEG